MIVGLKMIVVAMGIVLSTDFLWCNYGIYSICHDAVSLLGAKRFRDAQDNEENCPKCLLSQIKKNSSSQRYTLFAAAVVCVRWCVWLGVCMYVIVCCELMPDGAHRVGLSGDIQ